MLGGLVSRSAVGKTITLLENVRFPFLYIVNSISRFSRPQRTVGLSLQRRRAPSIIIQRANFAKKAKAPARKPLFQIVDGTTGKIACTVQLSHRFFKYHK